MTIEGPFRAREELGASLAGAGVSARDQSKLMALAKPALALVSKAAPDSAIPLGASKIGGAPDVPDDFVWPMRGPSGIGMALLEQSANFMKDNPPLLDERAQSFFWEEHAAKRALFSAPAPFAFMLQVNLAACAVAGAVDPDLPTDGRLLVFYDLVLKPWFGRDTDGTPLLHVFHDTSPVDQLMRRPPPDLGEPLFGDLLEFRNQLPPARLTPVFTWTLPDSGSEPILLDYEQAPHQAWLEANPTSLSARNRLGGWPENIQGDMPVELAAYDAGIDLPFGDAFRAAALRLRPAGREWFQLLQIGDYDNKINDFDGLFHVWIKHADPKRRAFGEANLIFRTS